MPIENFEPLSQQALGAFQQDLPRLWAERPGQWVACLGSQQQEGA
jgi:hypothetical protein